MTAAKLAEARYWFVDDCGDDIGHMRKVGLELFTALEEAQGQMASIKETADTWQDALEEIIELTGAAGASSIAALACSGVGALRQRAEVAEAEAKRLQGVGLANRALCGWQSETQQALRQIMARLAHVDVSEATYSYCHGVAERALAERTPEVKP